MYQASREVYQDYGATVLAWGGAFDAEARQANTGLKVFGSVGMVTEFSRYCQRFPDTCQEGFCRDLDGKPFKVPWLTDHQYKGVPYYWCCTRQPVFRQYLAERVIQTVKAGADGVHIDDHLGTAGALWKDCCFCDRCVEEFRDFLKQLPEKELSRSGIQNPATFDYRDVLRKWLAEHKGRGIQQHPLWPLWRIYQLRGAAEFMAELRRVAASTAGHPVPMSANAGLLWGPHLNDYMSLDCFSAEIEHHAEQKRFSDNPIAAYRLADAVGRPLASTASGGDWAFIKANNLPGLVQGWIALGYAAGGYLMAPNRQWCYTPEKGTHWYEGPKEKFAPLYSFVRANAKLFDRYENCADLTLAFSFRTFDRDPRKVLAICERLARANISYNIALGGDQIVYHPLPAAELQKARRVLVIEPNDFNTQDRSMVDALSSAKRLDSVEQALAVIHPAARVEGETKLRLFPRVKEGSAVVHVINWDYDPGSDSARPVKDLSVRLDLAALGVPGAKQARLSSPGKATLVLPLVDGRLRIPELDLWSVMEMNDGQ